MKRRRLEPKPILNGIYLRDPDTKEEVFVPWNELQDACTMALDPGADEFTGKCHYTLDPTYNLRRKK